jgi:general secretion pathway protein G
MRACGFTLIELLVTLALLAVLASIALPLAQVAQQRNQEEALRSALWSMRDAIDRYKLASDEGKIQKSLSDSGYPPDLQTLVNGVIDQTSPARKKIYFLRRIPRDPFCDCPSRSAEQTWALRSYESPPDNPRSGRDVYDVHTQSRGVGLNGVPYREW